MSYLHQGISVFLFMQMEHEGFDKGQYVTLTLNKKYNTIKFKSKSLKSEIWLKIDNPDWQGRL